jgi:signal transduction histidine kinase/ActR/RegA family two-component response regulator
MPEQEHKEPVQNDDAAALQQIQRQWQAEIAARKRVEQELRRRTEELAEAHRRNDEFVNRLSHEFRNPLAPLRNGLHILQMPNADAAIKQRALHLMAQQVNHLTRLVDELLEVARITRGAIPLHKETLDLSAIVNQTVESVRPLLQAQRQQCTLSLPATPAWLEADPTRLQQVLSHLLNNATKYTDACGQIHLTVEREGREVAVHVRDTGIGIPPELLPRIFDLFTQEERSLARSQGGLGIGLTLVRKLTELMGGRVTAHSDGPGKGSEFVLRLPALPEAAGVESPSCSVVRPDRSAGRPNVQRARPLRVLVVEDSEPLAVLLVSMLEMWGHEVRAAGNGPVALQVARSYLPDVILLDIGLPGMNGYDVARQLRTEAPQEKFLIAAMTGYDREEHRRRSQEAGFDHHLVKPVEPDALEAVLANAELRAPVEA